MQSISIQLSNSINGDSHCEEFSPTVEEQDLIDRITQIAQRESLNFQNYTKLCCCFYPKSTQKSLHEQVKTTIDNNLQQKIDTLFQKIEQQDLFIEQLRDTNHDKMKNALHGIFGTIDYLQTTTESTTTRNVYHSLEAIQDLSDGLLQKLNENFTIYNLADKTIDSTLNLHHLSSDLARVGVSRSLYRDYYGYLFPLKHASTIVPIANELARELQEALEESESSINPQLQQRLSRLNSIHNSNRISINNLMLLNTQEMRFALEDLSNYAEYLRSSRDFLSTNELEILKYKSSRLSKLFHENLDFFHLVTGTFQLSSEEFSLSQLLEEFQSSHDSHVVINAPPHLPSRLVGDPARIRTILESITFDTTDSDAEDVINLIVNFDHIKDGSESGKIVLRFHFIGKNTTPGKDTGGDLAARLSESAMRRPYIAEALINLMDGEIQVPATSGAEGFETKYAFTLKLEQSEKAVSSLGKTLSIEEATLRLRGKKMLIVDDSRVNRRMIALVLNKAGIKTEEAVDGSDAVEKLKNDPSYDLVLMDLSMPIMDGYQATKEIRETLKLHHLPILALSGEDPETSKPLALRAGMNAFATKPYKADLFPLMDTLITEAEEVSHWEENGLKADVLALQNVSPVFGSRATSNADLTKEDDLSLQRQTNIADLAQSLLKLKNDKEIITAGY